MAAEVILTYEGVVFPDGQSVAWEHIDEVNAQVATVLRRARQRDPQDPDLHLFRVLRRGGRLFHYTGNLASKHGHRVALGIVRRLKDASFARVVRCPAACGLVAYRDG
jgi:hypothetical protein